MCINTTSKQITTDLVRHSTSVSCEPANFLSWFGQQTLRFTKASSNHHRLTQQFWTKTTNFCNATWQWGRCWKQPWTTFGLRWWCQHDQCFYSCVTSWSCFQHNWPQTDSEGLDCLQKWALQFKRIMLFSILCNSKVNTATCDTTECTFRAKGVVHLHKKPRACTFWPEMHHLIHEKGATGLCAASWWTELWCHAKRLFQDGHGWAKHNAKWWWMWF